MARYIELDALVAEIEKRRDKNARNKLNLAASFEDNYLLSFINTIETKEVDLDKEIDSTYRNYVAFGRQEIAAVAKHFFELGLKAKGE